MSETKFPVWKKYQLDESRGYTVMISRLEIDDWFKRCIAEFPDASHDEWVKYSHHKWFDKWFSQFNKNHDKEVE